MTHQRRSAKEFEKETVRAAAGPYEWPDARDDS